jgi:glycosyltransferase involved in cell wall biosynthesis
MAGRLLYYKRFDIGIQAFNELGKRLLIVGNGPELQYLKKIKKSPRIEFITGAGDEDLRKFYVRAKGFLFPQIEDFGLTAAEAQACGTPVIAYGVGGGAEIVENGKTGVLFDAQTPQSLCDAVERFERINFDERYIRKRSERFSKRAFKENLEKVIYKSGFHL